MIISLSGIDCAGKTTQMLLLEEHLHLHNLQTKRVWHRPGYGPELDGLRALIRKVRPSALPRVKAAGAEVAEQSQREELFSRPGVQKLWARTALVDTFIQRAIKPRLMSEEVAIWDRGPHDALIDLNLRMPSLAVSDWRMTRLLHRGLKQPDVQVLLMIPYQTMLERQAEKNEPFPDSTQIRKLRYDAYVALSQRDDFLTIDGTLPREEIHEQIWKQARMKLGL